MKIQIVSGFLGAGKTTFLNKYLPYLNGKTVVIENEFGEVGLDKKLIKNGVPVKEINSGCICCNLVTDFKNGIEEIISKYSPDRIIVEPSGVAQLSDIIKVCNVIDKNIDIEIEDKIVIVDACSFEDCVDVFGNFYLDQLANASLVFFSNIGKIEKVELGNIVKDIKKLNPFVDFFLEDWRFIDGETLISVIEKSRESNNIDSDKKTWIHSKMDESNANSVFESISFNNIKKHSEKDMEILKEKIESGEFGRVIRSKGIIQIDYSDIQTNNDKTKNIVSIESEKVDVDVERDFWHFDSNLSSFNFEKIKIDELNNIELIDKTGQVILIGIDLEFDKIKSYFSKYKGITLNM